MKQSNWTMMGKGGVGKSFITWLLAQYYMEQGRNTYFADTDPNNATFASFPEIAAEHIMINEHNRSLNKGPLDGMLNKIASSEYSIIDNGASSFSPVMSYLSDENIIGGLQSIGQQVIMHMPLVGGSFMKDTLWGIDLMFRETPADVVVWQNDYYGPEAPRFENTNLYKEFRSRVLGIVHLPKRDENTAVKTIKDLYTKGQILDESASPAYGFIEKSRISNFRTEVFDKLDALGL